MKPARKPAPAPLLPITTLPQPLDPLSKFAILHQLIDMQLTLTHLQGGLDDLFSLVAPEQRKQPKAKAKRNVRKRKQSGSAAPDRKPKC